MAWEITPQGYLKTTARITKGGILQYYGHELGLTDSRANKVINVNRTIEELTKTETLKSIDGMPLTITHPDKKSVDAKDWKDKTVGHVQCPRQEGNYIVCDAYVQDAPAIELLKDKDIRELSVGYEPADIQEENGKFYHKNIRVNHVAFVVEGRAGSDCRLNDNKGKPIMTKKNKVLALIDSLRKKLVDADGDLSKEEINKQIDELMAQLEEVQGKEDNESKSKAEELQKQIDDLKAQLESLQAPNDDDSPDGKDAEILRLTQENEEKDAKIAELEAKIAELENEKGTGEALADAKTRFPKVNLSDSKSARDVHSLVLVDGGIFTAEAVKKLTDSEIRTAYLGYCASNKPKSDFGKKILADNKQNAVSASKRLGGK